MNYSGKNKRSRSSALVVVSRSKKARPYTGLATAYGGIQALRAIPRPLRGYARIGGNYGRYTRGGEMKFKDTTISISGNTSGALGTSFNLVAQGDTEQERNGRKITVKKVHFRGQVDFNATSTITQDSARIIFYLDKQANGAVATVAGILQGTPNALSFNNLSNSSRFVILKDYYIPFDTPNFAFVPSTDAFVGGTNTVKISFNKKCNIPIEFDASATTGAITTIRSNNIGCMMITDEASTCVLVGVARIRFSDN